MKSSFCKLIETALDVSSFLGVSSFESFIYDSGSYVDLYVDKIVDPIGLCSNSHGVVFKIFLSDRGMFVRLYEDFEG